MDIRIMREPTELEKQQYQRLIELSDMARQRYLNAGGDPRRSAGSLHGNDYLTDEERKEFLQLGRQVFGVQIKDGYVHLSCGDGQRPTLRVRGSYLITRPRVRIQPIRLLNRRIS
jgi:hypothetical protein